jgi:transcriptional regulator with XRE-family HTH domain
MSVVKANGEAVRRLRIQRGIEQDGLAAKAHLSSKTVQKVEAGKSVSLKVLVAVAEALNVDHLALMVEEGSQIAVNGPHDAASDEYVDEEGQGGSVAVTVDTVEVRMNFDRDPQSFSPKERQELSAILSQILGLSDGKSITVKFRNKNAK